MFLILNRKGYTVATAKNGMEAIEKIKERSFDIVFIDIKMPFMNGVETYKKIKKIKPGTVVIMMTAYSVEDLVQEALREGVYGVIYKPLDIEKVLVIIDRVKKLKQGALILVVDDSPGICNTLRNILFKKGYKVDIAPTGEEAIARAKELKHDFIFIDMKLPTINGLETYLAIKEVNPEVVAILMTGYRYDMAELVQQALENNAYSCLYKPLDMDEVLRLINEIWERKQKVGLLE